MSYFFIGICGGCLVEFLNLYKLRTKKTWPEYYKTYSYWILTSGMILLGGIFAIYLASGILSGLYIGATCPTIIEKMISGKYR